MGVSTLHHHFRVLTSMSPLQYQKQLRLQSARNLMLNSGLDAASAAFGSRLRKRNAVQSRIQPLLRPASDARRSSASFSGCFETRNWSVAYESVYSQSCCALSQWTATRQLARNGLGGDQWLSPLSRLLARNKLRLAPHSGGIAKHGAEAAVARRTSDSILTLFVTGWSDFESR